jgi:hypothetical protein
MVWSGVTGTASSSATPGGTDGTSNPDNGFDAGDVGKWIFLNNTSASTVAINSPSMSFVNSGITMVAGTKYHFEIEVDPVNERYKPSISDGTNSFTSSGYLGFRNQDDGLTRSWLFFGLGLTPTSADLGYSVDSISIEPASQPGDFDADGDVDGADFIAWQTNFPLESGATSTQGDADGDNDVDGADFAVWQTNFPFSPSAGASPVPEPAAFVLAFIAAAACYAVRRKKRLLDVCRSKVAG